jgi:hypothetical protein
MKKIILEMLFSWISQSLLKSAKVKCLVTYLKILSGTRKGLIALLLALFSLQLLVFVFLTLIGLGIYFLPQDIEVKLVVLTCVLGVLFVSTLCFLFWLFSEKTWLEKSGAQQMISELNR